MLRCRQLPTAPKPFRLETFWLHNKDAKQIVEKVWSSQFVANSPISTFSDKTLLVHKALRDWHNQNFASINVFLANAKILLSCLDALEEHRQLSPLEFNLRILARERAYELANVLEMRWHQRSRSRWLRYGDRNTKYFHSLATARKRKNHVNKIIKQGSELTDSKKICEAFTEYYVSLLGTSIDTPSFHPDEFFPVTTPDLNALSTPFTDSEIQTAVMGLANDKSSGPDGVPNEFYKLNWALVRPDLLAIFDSLYNGELQLQNFNSARLVLIPKEDNADNLTAFRPISVISYLPKLIAKVLSNRIVTFLPELIPESQTGFIRGRLIAENFIVARELISAIHKQTDPAFVLKLDFKKAFDSVAWPFLFKVLEKRGFPSLFNSWLRLLLTTSTSAVSVNDCLGPPFSHKRGLRQGDPLSPFLFILAVDVLNRMLQKASSTVPHSICPKLVSPFYILQYADDTLLFSTAKGSAVQTLKEVLTVFSEVSGILLNFNKCSLLPFNLSDSSINSITTVLQVSSTEFPLKYLGLPLTLHKPDRFAYQQIIDKLQRKLAGWKSSLLTRAGRVMLTSSVLSSIPVYFMSVFKLPAWVIKAIDRIRRNFIWGSSNNLGSGVHLLAWNRICLPKSLGGFGLRDLRLHNLALLLRWWWRLFNNPDSLWYSFARRLYAKRNTDVPPILWNSTGSFFWRDLFSIRFYFQICTASSVGSGHNTSFWYGNWAGSCLYYCSSDTKPPSNRFISLRAAMLSRHLLLPAPLTLQQNALFEVMDNLLFTGQPDSCLWKLTSNGAYSASSAYKFFISTGKVRFPLNCIWKLKTPPSIKLFLLLLAHGRILTQDQLFKRHIPFSPGCVLCLHQNCETATHLFFHCPFSRQLWQGFGFDEILAHTASFDSISHNMLLFFQSVSGDLRKLSLVATIIWALWLERNNRTFRQERRRLDAIHHWIIGESTLFMKFC
ncbi:hypothetical protein LUZ61_018262 [Rhynchospora tenuis]|uniref:Reverse transcriptase domain-containing protein n=1 Tax=Rhynchospora tenuis TaxID=198213 RepID=A0AAD5Z905_9POAL|nr:hypothetical protein LUZ61_018262 [Rhynchospora tenuis]